MMCDELLCKSDCEQTVSNMFAQYNEVLMRICTAILRDYYLAQDAVQETFAKAFTKLEGFRGEYPGSERAWLIQIAVNTCRDLQRTKWFCFVDGRVSVDSMDLVEAGNYTEAVLMKMLVDMLSVEHREAIMMYYFDDMTVDEIAQMTGKSTYTIYRRLREARKILKRLLQ